MKRPLRTALQFVIVTPFVASFTACTINIGAGELFEVAEDVDSDGDGLLDVDEGCSDPDSPDSDGDGVVDSSDPDALCDNGEQGEEGEGELEPTEDENEEQPSEGEGEYTDEDDLYSIDSDGDWLSDAVPPESS